MCGLVLVYNIGVRRVAYFRNPCSHDGMLTTKQVGYDAMGYDKIFEEIDQRNDVLLFFILTLQTKPWKSNNGFFIIEGLFASFA